MAYQKVVPPRPTREMIEAAAIRWTRLCHGYPPEPGFDKFITEIFEEMVKDAPVAYG